MGKHFHGSVVSSRYIRNGLAILALGYRRLHPCNPCNPWLILLCLVTCLQSANAITNTITFSLVRFQQGPATNRHVLITPLQLTPETNQIAVYDRLSFITDTNGLIVITNKMAGLYQVDIQAPPDKTTFAILVSTNNGSFSADTLQVAMPRTVSRPQDYPYSAQASDARYLKLASSVDGLLTNNFSGTITASGFSAGTISSITNRADYFFGDGSGLTRLSGVGGGTQFTNGNGAGTSLTNFNNLTATGTVTAAKLTVAGISDFLTNKNGSFSVQTADSPGLSSAILTPSGFTGDGNRLTNIPITSIVSPGQIITNHNASAVTLSSTVTATAFVGDGAGLSNVPFSRSQPWTPLICVLQGDSVTANNANYSTWLTNVFGWQFAWHTNSAVPGAWMVNAYNVWTNSIKPLVPTNGSGTSMLWCCYI
ncbi:MAG: hypothetical protein NT154_09865, partial [Verrucomicrobia bacterium]|nr:hypothetical protein [Verrucomicrobiota bacterium]